ncbi:MAG: hypothetical protein WAL93_17980 [Desulfobacterales bacterium]
MNLILVTLFTLSGSKAKRANPPAAERKVLNAGHQLMAERYLVKGTSAPIILV